MSGPVMVEFVGSEFEGVRFPVPGLSSAEVLEAWRLIAAGQGDAPEVERLKEALLAGMGPSDRWGPGDEAALCLAAQPGDGGWF